MRAVSDRPDLPEPFAPTGGKLSRFRIVPPPPLRPRLLPDEAKFALRISLLAGCAEFAAWSWLAHAGGRGAALGWAVLRLLRPLWSRVGTRVSRPVVAFALLFVALLGASASLATVGQLFNLGLLAIALPAVGDLCASCAGDSITVERRNFNQAVRDYNTRLRLFPGSIVARFSGYQPKAFFEAAPDAATPPKVKF